MAEELQAVSVGLSVNLGTLDRDLARIQKQIGTVEGEHQVSFTVGNINVAAARKEINTLLRQRYVIAPTFTVSRASAGLLRRDLQTKLHEAGPLTVDVKAHLTQQEIARIRREIRTALGEVPITVTARGVGGGSAGPNPHS